MAIQIETPDYTSSVQIVTINRKTYTINNRYNSRFDSWSVDIIDSQGSVIIDGEKVIPYKDLLTRYDKNDLVGGRFFIDSESSERVSRNNYGIDKTHTLTYATFEELEGLDV